MYVFIDTETNGLFDFSKEAHEPCQPYMAQVAMILTDRDLKDVSIVNYLIRPDGWEMSGEASEVNGLTTETLLRDGLPVGIALDAYTAMIESGYEVIAWNAQFDTKILRGALRRAGRDDMFAKTRNWCAMRASMSSGVRNAGGRGWPKLEHACSHFGIDVEPKPHNALHGARACLEVTRALRAGGATINPIVHYAKNRPDKAA